MPAGDVACHVCRQPLDPRYAVECIVCGLSVHIQPQDSGQDGCALAWTRPDACPIAFICKDCYSRPAGAP